VFCSIKTAIGTKKQIMEWKKMGTLLGLWTPSYGIKA
jgi:hypothetical protein